MTLLIIFINVMIFLLMVLSGVDMINPSAQSIHHFGGNFGPSVSSGEYWRLISANYIHIGIIHLLFNMWCLYAIGMELEALVGRIGFILLYTCSGVAGSLASFYFNYNSVGAGASGAIFGIAGAFTLFTLLNNEKNSISSFSGSYNPMIMFIFYNIIYGFIVPGIDNAAHLGGLAMGVFVGIFLCNNKFLHLN